MKKGEIRADLEHQFQIDTLTDFLLKCAAKIPDPPEESEMDPQDNEKESFNLDE